MDTADDKFDKYENPTDGSSLDFCCFPDCGCPGSRLCMAKNGPSSVSSAFNIEPGTLREELL